MEFRHKTTLWLEAFGATMAALWGAFPWVLQSLLILMAFDVVGGYIVALQRKDASSRPMFKGITKKVFVLLIIGATYQLWGAAMPEVCSAITGAYGVWELKSLLEKAAMLGIPVPAMLLRSMRVMQATYEGAQPEPTTQDLPPEQEITNGTRN